MDILQDLEFRGLLYQVTDYDELRERLSSGPVSLYVGFDPTADSLHIGHLLPLLGLRRFQLAGHKPIALVGGGTGLIGDPSGKSSERGLNPEEVVDEWTVKIRAQLERFLDFNSPQNPARIANNYDWLGKQQVITFLRDIGKYFPIGYMLSKDAVKSRLSTGISYTEFSYMILQSYDFLRLNEDYGCEMQAGGSDQWGNITAGIDLIRRVSNRKAYGLTFPLVTKSDGTKFGKTESGTIWLDPAKTTPYRFFQFWINTDDRDVIKFIKYFTFLSRDEIIDLEKEVDENPGKREAQRVLAREVTALVHGKDALSRAEKISQALFYGNVKDLMEDEIEEGLMDVPSVTIEGKEIGIVDLLVTAGISPSRRQAREDLKNRAIYINDQCVTDINKMLGLNDRLRERYTVIRRGKKNYFLVKWLS
ncbi:MAG: tyrosine--tRNA ligase [Dethiobacteria bacterium]|jgi:tyrosyl-tRNA synthetase